ncbi:hypothetical protein MAIT1_03165 [Magnetofaba australis IT-1]|uniref:Secreted Zn-dependent protease n=1 Tax=Magnetofaba australis IT-1 TaxID=1434232 RepID=A0A1Y2K5R5_9PROT|nr:hypothetical protein MAIT1_03165 [Magnetofaba australis IT-1]
MLLLTVLMAAPQTLRAQERDPCAKSFAHAIAFRYAPITLEAQGAQPASLFKLKRLAGQPNARILGYTQTHFFMQLPIYRTQRFERAGGSACYRIAEITLRFGYDKMLVHYLDKYQPGSCPYATILAHEQEHVDAYNAKLKTHAPALAATLKKWASRQVIPVRDFDTEMAQDALRQKIKRGFELSLRQLQRRIQLYQADIDDDVWRRLQPLCSDW